jgi:hypothetical protein
MMKGLKNVHTFESYQRMNEALTSGTYAINISPFGKKEKELAGKEGIAIIGVKGDVSMLIEEIAAELNAKGIISNPNPEKVFTEMHGVAYGEGPGDDTMDLFLVMDSSTMKEVDIRDLKNFLDKFGNAMLISDYF